MPALSELSSPLFQTPEEDAVGGKVRKEYESAETRYERVRRSPGVSAEAKDKSKKEFGSANTFGLTRSLEKKFKKIFTLKRHMANETKISLKLRDESKVHVTGTCAQPPLHSRGCCLKRTCQEMDVENLTKENGKTISVTWIISQRPLLRETLI